jgi:hypothetical protein
MIRSYCTCGWNDIDDDNDTNFNNHVFGDMSSNHRMCSFGEWNLCKEVSNKDSMITNLESQLEENCSEEVILLREKVIVLENQVEKLKEKLYEITTENDNNRKNNGFEYEPVKSSTTGGDTSTSRLSRRRNKTG